MNRIILAFAAAAISSATLVGGAQANTIWRYPYKRTSYAVPHAHAQPPAGKVAAGKPVKRHVHR